MNDVTKKKKSEISTHVFDFTDLAGAGFENVNALEMAIPFFFMFIMCYRICSHHEITKFKLLMSQKCHQIGSTRK